VAESYAAARSAVTDAQLDCYVSIKAPSIQYECDLLFQILRSSNGSTGRLHFDSLGPETADPTFLLITEALPEFPNLSCTLPGRWKRSTADADWAIQQNLAVRVVKGQWPDPAKPVDMREGFLEVIDRLAGRARHVGVATHDPDLARESLLRLQDTGTSCELELLHGLPMEQALGAAKELNTPVRIYLPYGQAWLPYSLRQAVRNPRILFWILRDTIGRHLHEISSSTQA
jgi:proline dehydrogenase